MNDRRRSELILIAIEVSAIAMRMLDEVGAQVKQVDAAIEADLSNDPDLMDAQRCYNRAAELDPGPDRDASMTQGAIALRTAMAKDFGDTTKETLRAMIIPFQAKLEGQLAELKKLLGRLEQTGKVAA